MAGVQVSKSLGNTGNWKDDMPAPTVATLPSLPWIKLLTGQCRRKIMKLLGLQPSALPKQYRSTVPPKCRHTAGAGFPHVYFCYMPHGKENIYVQRLPLPPEVLTAVNSMQYIENEEWPE